MENLTELRAIKLTHLEELKELSYRAFYWTSHDPEGRGLRTLINFDNELTQDLEKIPENEADYFKAKYIAYLHTWLCACSRCASSFITGGAGFNTRKAEIANNSERNRYDDFREWREWQFKQIAKRQELAKSPEERNSELIDQITKDIILTFKEGNGSYFYSLLYQRVEKYAYKGMVDVIKAAVAEVVKQNDIYNRITQRHKFFKLVELAEKHASKIEATKETLNKEEEIEGVKVIHNTDLDRLQLIFEGKPAQDIITLLKKNAFRWSPSNKAWQRQLTPNAIYAANKVIEAL
jgi:hypothetical protein